MGALQGSILFHCRLKLSLQDLKELIKCKRVSIACPEHVPDESWDGCQSVRPREQKAWSLRQSDYNLFSGSPLSFGSKKEKAYTCNDAGGMGDTWLRIKRSACKSGQLFGLQRCTCVCLQWERRPQTEWEMWTNLEIEPAWNNIFLFSHSRLPYNTDVRF